MIYKEIIFTIFSQESHHRDLLIDQLADFGFDSFDEQGAAMGLKAYIPAEQFDEERFKSYIKNLDGPDFYYEIKDIPSENWNAVWESNFEPLEIAGKIHVRASFQEPKPDFPIEIVIDPKMAFGTGHHQTTSLMMEMMLEEDFKGKKVLDMGCGTGILAILAEKLGAIELDAIDFDPLCYDSTIENTAANQCSRIRAICGPKEAIPQKIYDIVLANINRNILLDQMERYTEVLIPGGILFLSGFYESPDLDILKEKAASLDLVYAGHQVNKDWTAAKFIKS